MKVIMLGDSITKGYKPDGYTPYTLARTIASKTGYDVLNAGYNGAQVVAGKGAFTTVVNQYNFADYDMVIIMYGTNDFGWQDEKIDTFKKGYQEALNKIKRDSSTIKIKLVTPIHEFAFASGDLDFRNNHGVSQNMISNAIDEIAKRNHVDLFDWRKHAVVTDASQLYSDGTHPKDETYKAMGEALANWIISGDSDVAQATVTNVDFDKVNRYEQVGPVTQDNYEQAMDALSTIFSHFSTLIGDSFKFDPTLLNYPDTGFDRAMWLYIVRSFDDIQQYVNKAIGIFRSNGFANMRTHKEFDYLELTRPTMLLIDQTYQTTLNDNWDKIQTALNDLLIVLKKFHILKGDK